MPERRKRAEKAQTSVVANRYLLGVSTRRMEKLVDSLRITSLSKSQVSVMAKDLDAQVEAIRRRPLDGGPYPFVAADAHVLVREVRENGRVVNVHTLVAAGVNAEGFREILGIEVTSAEDGAGWLACFRSLVARGERGPVGDLRRPRRPRRGNRGVAARGCPAEMSNAAQDQAPRYVRFWQAIAPPVPYMPITVCWYGYHLPRAEPVATHHPHYVRSPILRTALLALWDL